MRSGPPPASSVFATLPMPPAYGLPACARASQSDSAPCSAPESCGLMLPRLARMPLRYGTAGCHGCVVDCCCCTCCVVPPMLIPSFLSIHYAGCDFRGMLFLDLQSGFSNESRMLEQIKSM